MITTMALSLKIVLFVSGIFRLRMRRSLMWLARPLVSTRGFCTISDKIVASVLFERLPVVIPKIDPVIYAFQEFS